MIKIFGDLYYIDFEKLDAFVADGQKDNVFKTVDKEYNYDNELVKTKMIETAEPTTKEVNVVRYEIIRNFIDDISMAGGTSDEHDEMLGSNNLIKTDVKFKLAYNTLIFYKILKKID
jgi:hypothetical protein